MRKLIETEKVIMNKKIFIECPKHFPKGKINIIAIWFICTVTFENKLKLSKIIKNKSNFDWD